MNEHQPPQVWHPEENPDYDAILGPASAEVLRSLDDVGKRLAFLKDSRPTHRYLYERLTPNGQPEYAGTFRGTLGTSLEKRTLGARMVSKPGAMKAFLEPHKVHSAMTTGFFQQALNPLLASTPVSREQHFAAATKLFFIFGLIHPYLDGNGHIQRLIFTAAIRQHSELKLRPSWTIHPRPYDVEMATAFEQQLNAAQAVADVLRAYVFA
jgi:fido (protein-threonine AMPylation protein)